MRSTLNSSPHLRTRGRPLRRIAAAARKPSIKAIAVSLLGALLLGLAGPAASVDLRSGDIVYTTLWHSVARLWHVDPRSNVRTLVSDVGLLTSPRATAGDSLGNIFVLDKVNGLIRVDASTGAQTRIFSERAHERPSALWIENERSVFVAGSCSFYRVDVFRGVGSTGVGHEVPLQYCSTLGGLSREGNAGELFVTTYGQHGASFGTDGSVFGLSPFGGGRLIVEGAPLVDPKSIAEVGGRVFVADDAAGHVFEVDPTQRTVEPWYTPAGFRSFQIARGSSGSLIILEGLPSVAPWVPRMIEMNTRTRSTRDIESGEHLRGAGAFCVVVEGKRFRVADADFVVADSIHGVIAVDAETGSQAFLGMGKTNGAFPRLTSITSTRGGPDLYVGRSWWPDQGSLSGAVHRLDPVTGCTNLVSSAVLQPKGLLTLPGGSLLVSDRGASGYGGVGGVWELLLPHGTYRSPTRRLSAGGEGSFLRTLPAPSNPTGLLAQRPVLVRPGITGMLWDAVGPQGTLVPWSATQLPQIEQMALGISGAGILVASPGLWGASYGQDGSVYRVFPEGQPEWLASGAPLVDPGGVTQLPDGRVFVSDRAANMIFEVSAVGERPPNPNAPPAVPRFSVDAPESLVTGHDGSLIELALDGAQQTSRILRIDPDSNTITVVSGSGFLKFSQQVALAPRAEDLPFEPPWIFPPDNAGLGNPLPGSPDDVAGASPVADSGDAPGVSDGSPPTDVGTKKLSKKQQKKLRKKLKKQKQRQNKKRKKK